MTAMIATRTGLLLFAYLAVVVAFLAWRGWRLERRFGGRRR